MKVVVAGAGASAIACAKYYIALGIKQKHILMCDSNGILTKQREQNGELNQYKSPFVQDVPEGGLADALDGADLFLGLSRGGLVTKEMVKKMANKTNNFRFGKPHSRNFTARSKRSEG